MPTVLQFVSAEHSVPLQIVTLQPSVTGTAEKQPELAFQVNVNDTRLSFSIFIWLVAYSIGIIALLKGLSGHLARWLKAIMRVGETNVEGNYQIVYLQTEILRG